MVAALDAVFGALRAFLDGIFNDKVFVISFVSNVVIAALIVFLGDKLGVGAQLSTGVIVVLGHPDLLQRRRDPPAHLPRMSTTPMNDAPQTPRRRAAPPAARAMPGGSRARLLEALRTPSRSQLAAAVLLGLLGFATVTQVQSNQQDDTYAGLRSADLVQLLNGLNAEARRADNEIADLEQTRSQLSDSTQRREAALKRATEESTTLGILAGTLPAQGPGIRIDGHRPRRTR